MNIALIAAVSQNGVIGINNALPWYLPDDLQYFKRITMGKPVIMGRKTFESLKKPLPGRTNIVLTATPEALPATVRAVCDLEQGLRLAQQVALIDGVEEIMVIGGEQVYRAALPQAQRLYLTCVEAEFGGDAFFPEWDASEWQELSCEQKETPDGLHYRHRVLTKS